MKLQTQTKELLWNANTENGDKLCNIIGISGKVGKLNICGVYICWEIFEFLK